VFETLHSGGEVHDRSKDRPEHRHQLAALQKISGYSYLNVFVRFTQDELDEPPVDLA
jgi:hypothetical protein